MQVTEQACTELWVEVRDQPCGSSAPCFPPLSLQGSKLFYLQVRPSQQPLWFSPAALQSLNCSLMSCRLRSNWFWVGKHNLVTSAGSTPVPATSKADIDAALQKLTDKKQQWVRQPCARRAELLRACVQQALLVRSEILNVWEIAEETMLCQVWLARDIK